MCNDFEYNNSDKLYLTQEEMNNLLFELRQKEIELNHASKTISEATTQSSETWHDNAPFDAAVEHTKILDIQYKALLNKVRNATVVTPPKNQCDHIIF